MSTHSRPVEHLSYSSVQTYLLCGRCWELKYIEGLPAPVSPAMAFGGAFHETVEEYIRFERCARPDLDVDAIWTRQWTDKLEAEGDNIAWGDDNPEDLHALGLRMLNAPESQVVLRDLAPAIARDGTLAIERRVDMTIPGVPVPVMGYIDLIGSDGVPADFKTAARSWNEDEARWQLQPAFYIAALEQAGDTGNHERRFRHIVFTKTKTPRAQVIETVREPGDLAFMADLVRTVWKGIEVEVFPPNPMSWKCSPTQCEYWEVCRARASKAAG